MKITPKQPAQIRQARQAPTMLSFLQEGAPAKATGWAPKTPARSPLVDMPMAQFEAKAKRATVRQLIDMRTELTPAYQVAQRDETRATNRDVIRRFDVVDQRIAQLSR